MDEVVSFGGRLVNTRFHQREKSSKVVILVSGISGGSLGNRFDPVTKDLNDAGFSFLRVELWKNHEEACSMSYEEIHKMLDDAVLFVESKGCRVIGLLGKSFGGGISLTYKNPKVVASVLWAPGIRFNSISTLNSIYDKRICDMKGNSYVERLMSISVGKDFLSSINRPVLLIHGTKDEYIPVDNSRNICDALSNGKLFVVEGADHSYHHHMELVVKETVDFFKSNLLLK